MINKRLRELQKTLNVTIKEMAEKTGLPYPTIQSYLLDKRSPSAQNINKIAQAFGVNSDWILTGEGDMFIEKTGMPNEFIEKLKKDLAKSPPEVINGLSFKDKLVDVFLGKERLSRVEVIELTRALNQPAEEYLKLAKYMSDVFDKVLKNNKVATMLRKMGGLNDKEIDEVLDSLSLLLDGYLSRKKKD